MKNESQNKFDFNLGLKGAIGETIIKGLLMRSGYKVRHYGVEYLVPELSSWEFGKPDFTIGDERSKAIVQTLPDFLVYNENGDVYLVEAKFCTDRKDVKIYNKYLFPRAYFFFVMLDNIYFGHASNPNDISSLLHDDDIIKKNKVVNLSDGLTMKYYPFEIPKDLILEALSSLEKIIS